VTPVVILKFGGEVVADAVALSGMLADVATLSARGFRFVLCHGGGPQAGALSTRLRLETVKVAGQRVTDAATLQVMKQTLAGEVSVDVVAAAVTAGVRAVGISGVSDGLVTASRRPPVVVGRGGSGSVDYGLVGDIERIRPELLRHLWAGGFVPVVNTLGLGTEPSPDGLARQVYNINADTVAATLAGVLKADHLMLVTDVGGVLRDKDDPATRISRLTAQQARDAIADGTVVGGMIPKIEEALDNLAAGIGAVHIVPPGAGVIQHAIEHPGRYGTVLVADPEHADG